MYGVIDLKSILEISYFNASYFNTDTKRRMIGILFAKPNAKLVSKEILKNLDYFHVRSGKFIDFFFPGYGPKDPDNKFAKYDIEQGKSGWQFNMYCFVKSIEAMESITNWEYSGETDLILTDITINKKEHKAEINFDITINCLLDEFKRIGAIDTIHTFFENIFKFTKDKNKDNPTYSFSDFMGIKRGQEGILRFFQSLLPKELASAIVKTAVFRVRNLKRIKTKT